MLPLHPRDFREDRVTILSTTAIKSADHESTARQSGTALGLVLSAVILMRLPLWLLPGPGRDEAAYHYWALHLEPPFAPLVQAVVAVFDLFEPFSLWSVRTPVALLGLLVLYLGDLRLRQADIGRLQ